LNRKRTRIQSFTLALLAVVAIAGFAKIIEHSRKADLSKDAAAFAHSANAYNSTVTGTARLSGTHSADGGTAKLRLDGQGGIQFPSGEALDLSLDIALKSGTMVDWVFAATYVEDGIVKVNDDYIGANGKNYKKKGAPTDLKNKNGYGDAKDGFDKSTDTETATHPNN